MPLQEHMSAFLRMRCKHQQLLLVAMGNGLWCFPSAWQPDTTVITGGEGSSHFCLLALLYDHVALQVLSCEAQK